MNSSGERLLPFILPLHPSSLLIDRPRIHDRLNVVLAAEDDEQVAHHLRLALLVEFDDVLLLEQVQRHVHHADRAFDDALARGDDGAGLLALQHRRGDFRRVSQVADARFRRLDARRIAPASSAADSYAVGVVTRPGSRVVISCSTQPLPSGSENETKEE